MVRSLITVGIANSDIQGEVATKGDYSSYDSRRDDVFIFFILIR